MVLMFSVLKQKTDAFTIKSTDLDNAKACIARNHGDIGGWRCSKEENINLPSDTYKYQLNYEIKIKIPTFERVELNNEWDCDKKCDIFEEKKRVMIRANLPGSGKSYACEHMKTRDHNVLFVCPTNKLVQKYVMQVLLSIIYFQLASQVTLIVKRLSLTIVIMILLYSMKSILVIYRSWQELKNIAIGTLIKLSLLQVIHLNYNQLMSYQISLSMLNMRIIVLTKY